MAKGRNIYLANCAACHLPDGRGAPGAFPPLAGSDYLVNNRTASVRAVLFGLQGPITVNGEQYNGIMPGVGYLGDDDIAAVLTYVFRSWGNDLEPVSVEEVAAARRSGS